MMDNNIYTVTLSGNGKYTIWFAH